MVAASQHAGSGAGSSTNAATLTVATISAPMSKIGKAVPLLPKGLSDAERNRESVARDYLVEGINLLVHYKRFRSDAVGYIKKCVLEELNRESAGPDCFVAVSTWGSLDATWLSKQVSVLIQVTVEDMGRATAFDSKAAAMIWCFIHNVSTSAAFPESCLNQIVYKMACELRRKDVGDRVRLLVEAQSGEEKFLDVATGKVNWKFGVYWLEFSSTGVLVKITHRPTGHSVTEGLDYITDEWDLQKNWSDMLAELVIGTRRKEKLCTFFIKKKKEGPFACETISGECKLFEPYVQRAAQERAKTTVDEHAVTVKDVEAFSTPAKTMQQESAKRAREGLAKRAEDREKKRRVTLKVRPAAKTAAQPPAAAAAAAAGEDMD